MAGSGDLSRIGWLHALNAGVGSTITGAVGIGPAGDLIGTLSAAMTAGVVTTFTCSAGTSKAIPANALLVVVDAAGTLTTQEMFMVTTAYATGTATAMNITSQTFKTTHAIGALVYLSAFAPFETLTTTTPTSHALGTEYGATGMARQPLTLTATTVADPPVSANNAIITFGPMTAGTGSSITNGEIMDALTGGTADNMYAFFTWGTAKTPGVGDSVQIAAAAQSVAGS
jgi:hypothetical protein